MASSAQTSFRATLQVTTGVELIAAERIRQIAAEGWTPEHDDQHAPNRNAPGALSDAAAGYALAAYLGRDATIPKVWPWDAEWWKPASPLRMLVKAGALIAAEIDRRLRAGETL